MTKRPGAALAGRPAPRRLVQLLFLVITLVIGINFFWFVVQINAGGNVTVTRPPGVEAFLPISALISLKYFLFTGIFNHIHPAALVLFLVICTTALLFKKVFCSWICPVGFICDLLAGLHLTLFKKQHRPARRLDLTLRSLKYILAAFFLWNIFIAMPVQIAGQFIDSPYNRFADIKMLEFFTGISPVAGSIILVIAVLCMAIPYFWCRYLCPYGALLGLIGLMSLGKIKRDSTYCSGCRKCSRACPAGIKVSRKNRIYSPECSTCLRCVDACPEKQALKFSFFHGPALTPIKIGAVLVLLFVVSITTARLTGYWQTSIPINAYLQYAGNIH